MLPPLSLMYSVFTLRWRSTMVMVPDAELPTVMLFSTSPVPATPLVSITTEPLPLMTFSEPLVEVLAMKPSR